METSGFSFSPVVYSYPRGHVIGAHSHPFPQLLFASSGVLSVEVPKGTWVVPPQRAVWLPADCKHLVRMLTDVQITSMYIKRTKGLEDLDCDILEVSSLLRELLLASLKIDADVELTSREIITFQLLQEELRLAAKCTPAIPLPQDRRLVEVCRMIVQNLRSATPCRRWLRGSEAARARSRGSSTANSECRTADGANRRASPMRWPSWPRGDRPRWSPRIWDTRQAHSR